MTDKSLKGLKLLLLVLCHTQPDARDPSHCVVLSSSMYKQAELHRQHQTWHLHGYVDDFSGIME